MGSSEEMTAELHSRQLAEVGQALAYDLIAEAGRQWAARWGDAAVPSMMGVTSIMRVQHILMARLNAMLKPYDLTFPRYEALMLIYFSRNGSLPLGKMGARLQVHPTSVTNLIDGLERKRLVRREPHASDRRTTLASITERGREVAEEATRLLNEARFGSVPLAEQDWDTITDLLRTVRLDNGDFASDRPASTFDTKAASCAGSPRDCQDSSGAVDVVIGVLDAEV